MSRNPPIESMPEPRRTILLALKGQGALDIAELAARLQISYEAVRQQMTLLEAEGWIGKKKAGQEKAGSARGPGRPRAAYQLTTAGDHLFPKDYDELAVALIDAAGDRLGPEALRMLLAEVAQRKIDAWEPIVRDLTLEQRLQALRGVYRQDDPFCHLELSDDGNHRLVEMNCPYLEVARRRPALCSVTTSVLRSLLGRRVVRTERFQSGHGRCVFRVMAEAAGEVRADEPVFDWEPAPELPQNAG